MGAVNVADLRVDETYWPAGSSEMVRRWLVENYDPMRHPPLIVSPRDDGLNYVLGWEETADPKVGEPFPPLLWVVARAYGWPQGPGWPEPPLPEPPDDDDD